MISRRIWLALLPLIAVVAWLTWRLAPGKHTDTVPTNVVGTVSVPGAVAAPKNQVIVQTGPERMTNAVRCLSFVVGLANKLPRVEKSHFLTVAGVQFFDDCLMANMGNGYVTVTSNEIRQSFYKALAQVYSNHVPHELVEALDKPPPEGTHWQQSPKTMFEHDRRLEQYPDLALVEGFEGAFDDRNQMHLSLDAQYERIGKIKQLAKPINAFNAALKQAGVTDANQSDLKGMCLGLLEMKTTVYLIYGQQSDTPLPSEYQTYAKNLNRIIEWRLTNMYGLDNAAAQRLMQSMSNIPVKGFKHADLQPPAVLQ